MFEVKKPECEYLSGQDLSANCAKCGSTEVVSKELVNLEWAPFWAKYLAATGVLASVYRSVAKTASLNIGYCDKHKPGAIRKRIIAYGYLILGLVIIGVGVQIKMFLVSLAGVIFLFAFLGCISKSMPVKAMKIEGEKVWLQKPYPKS